MELKSLGNSNVKVTPLAFGAWAIGGWMWGGADDADSLKAIRAWYDLGMTTIDTAPAYGFGKSEELVSKALQGIARDKYQILTKYGLSWEDNQGEFYFDSKDNNGKPVKFYKYSAPSRVLQECENSLRRLKTDYIDLLQIHWHDPTTPIADTMGAVTKLLEQGKIRAAGVCNYTAQQVAEARKVVNIVSNQVPYSMINRAIEAEVVPQALKLGMSIVPYSPLQRGLLTGKIKSGHKFNDGDSRESNRFYTPENIDRANALLARIKPIADNLKVTLSQLAINWTTCQPGMDCVLVGARNEKQVRENVKSMDFKLSNDDLNAIASALVEFQLAEA